MVDLSKLTSWNSNWSELRVVVFGLGLSGFSAADTLAELGANVLVVAESADADLLDVLDVIGVEHVTGAAAKGLPESAVKHKPDLIIVSPGVRPEHALLAWALDNEVEVWVDIELAWRLRDKTDKIAEWVTITGTNGKTTTAQMVEAMLIQGSRRAIACGNIGTPILDAIRDPEGFDVLVVELSSFQLHYLGNISPYSSAVLNLADDHLDWHGNFDAYAAAKSKVYENTRVACVYNVNDLATEKMVENADVQEGARAIGFTTGIPSRSQVGFVENILCDRAFHEDRQDSALEIATLEDLSAIGVLTPHLMANAAAATALARSLDVAPEDILEALKSFKLDAHRIELVAESHGVRWIDDSKATNPHAAAASINSFDSVVWIVGGLLKGVDLTDLVSRFSSRMRAAVVIGKDRQLVLDALASATTKLAVVEVQTEDNALVMQIAVDEAAKLAQPGDVVLLAPAAASMDQFKDYADRGESFAAAVKAHLGNQS